MGFLAPTLETDTCVRAVEVTEHELTVALMDGRTIAVPLVWFPRLFNATPEQRLQWEICGGGYGLHWEAVDDDISTEGLLLGRRPPPGSEEWRSKMVNVP